MRDIRRLTEQGRSSAMYSFFVTFASGGLKHRKEFILRVYQEESGERGRKEFAVLKALKERNLPVPTAYCFEEDNKVLRARKTFYGHGENCGQKCVILLER